MSQKIYTDLDVKSSVTISTINNATTDTDKFLVSDGGTIKYRTGTQILSDIGAQPAGSYLTSETDTLQTVTSRGNTTTTSIYGGSSSTISTGYTGVYGTPMVGAYNGTKLIYLYNDGTNLKLDAYNYGTTSGLNVQIGGNGGYAYTDTSFRAPIFYDSGNTAYYLDPASTSNMSRLLLNGAPTSSEASLSLGAEGVNEGGQLILNKATSYTYAAHLDVWQDVFRILYGSNTASTGGVLSLNLSSRQLILHGYTSVTSYTGTAVANLAVDASGNVITVAAGGSSGVSSISAGTGVSVSSSTGAVTVSIGQSVATSATPSFDQVFTTNNGNGTNLKIGDDAWIGDYNAVNSIKVKGQQDATAGYISFGSGTESLGRIGTGMLTWGGSTIWNAGNDGSGSGLDADLLDGLHASSFQSALTLTTTGSGAATLVGSTLNIPTPSAATFTSLTTTGSSGSATLTSGVLNIPTYTLTGLGGQATLSGTGIVKSTAGTISYINGTTGQYVRGDGSLATFPTLTNGTVTSVAALTIGTTGTDITSTVANSTTTPVITLNIPTASAANRGALSAANWTTFNNKQNAITLTTTGSSGAATFVSNVLNIPNYGLAGLPAGGTAGQILTKVNATDYNATWQENYADWTSVVKHTVKNNGVALITKGTPVYSTGSDGTNILVGKAGNGAEATSSKTMGLMQSDITTTGGTQTGFVIAEGLLSGLNTAGLTAGDPVWLGPSGTLIYGLVNKPYAPAHLVFIGIVTKVSAGSGEIFVKVQNGFELDELHDVDLKTTTPINGHILGYNGTLWVNKTIAGWLGYTPADASHTHTFDSLTSKTGGTGTYTTSGDFRAPIFYDSNNTGYYLNPNGNSNVNRLFYDNYLVSQNTGGLMGDYNISGTTAKCIWTIGESWPLPNMYGLAYEYDGTYAHSLSLKTNGTTYNRLGFGSEGAYFTGSVTSASDFRAPIFYDTDDTAYYTDPASISKLEAIDTGYNGTYNIFRTWTELTDHHGLYSAINGAHIFPNNGSYGSWQVLGTRNGYAGFEFSNLNNGAITLMIDVNSNVSGFHNVSYGWQTKWENGTLYVGKNSYGGNEAVVLDSVNFGSYASARWYDGWVTNPGYNANTIGPSKSGFTYANNAPYNGPLVHFDAGGYGLQLNSPYSSGGYGITFRTKNGDTGLWNPWQYPAIYGQNANGGGALYSTIYYDSDNTAYYINPADADVAAVLRGTVTIGGGTGGNYDEGLRIIDSSSFSVIAFGATGNSGPGRFNLLKTNGDTFQLRNAASSVLWESDQSGNTWINLNLRTPIVYDLDNTGYYSNPNGTSSLSNVIADNTLRSRKSQTSGDYTTAAIWTESYSATTTGIAFHISGNVGKFLEMRTNGILYWNGDQVMTNSGTWGINITGSAGSATYAQNSTRLYASDGTYVYGGANPYYMSMTYNGSANRWRLAVTPATPAAVEVAYADTAGSAGTATTLQTARTINGTSFNGSANIETSYWGATRTLTIGNTGKTVNGSGNQSWTLAEIGAASSTHTHDLVRYSLAAPAFIDTLTTANFRTTLFGSTTNGYQISTSRWNNVPAPLTGLNQYGTMFAWAGSDTHGFIAMDYTAAALIVGGGSADNINWSRRVLVEQSWTNSKYFDTGGEIYGTRFYDANNSAYYLDPADTTKSLNVAGKVTVNVGSSAGTPVLEAISTYGTMSINTYYGVLHTSGDFYIGNPASSGNNLYGNQARFGSFIDRNNSAYYLTPSSTSVLNTLNMSFNNNSYGSALNVTNSNTGSQAIAGLSMVSGAHSGSINMFSTGSLDILNNNTTSGLIQFRPKTAPSMFIDNVTSTSRVTIGSSNTASHPLRVTQQVSNVSIYADYDIVAYSDQSVKENIRPIENVLDRVNKSRGVVYDRIDSGEKNNIGFIAQELEVEFPELVVTNEDNTKAVKYQNAVAVLFEAVKEQQKQIEELKELVNKLITK